MWPTLSSQQCADLHCRLVSDVFNILNDKGLAPVELWITGNDTENFFETLSPKPHVRNQQGVGLGMKMHHALNDGLQKYRYAILVGSDCPFITPQLLKEVITKLSTGIDCVLGPAVDGGYVLIGLSRVDIALFSDIDWGTDRVLAQTRSALQKLSWHWQELEALTDIDTPADLVNISDVNHYKDIFLSH